MPSGIRPTGPTRHTGSHRAGVGRDHTDLSE